MDVWTLQYCYELVIGQGHSLGALGVINTTKMNHEDMFMGVLLMG